MRSEKGGLKVALSDPLSRLFYYYYIMWWLWCEIVDPVSVCCGPCLILKRGPMVYFKDSGRITASQNNFYTDPGI